MVSISSLLNPLPAVFQEYRQLPSPCSSTYSATPSPSLPPLKKQKMSKDAAIFAKGKIKGEIRYRPCEIQDDETAEQHKRFQIYPMGHITDYCRHIPYNSEKKAFSEKTGRESFEVFQYTFKVPDEEKEYTVMWDYNVGLVRVTPFFKCCKYSKTTPAKMLNSNPGLREISHSITGGALAAQGYWLPFEAAKAVAATFCYNIRYALTPVFGMDFLSMCIEPEDPAFGRMIIERDVIRRCTEEANDFRNLSREGSMASSPRTPPPSGGYRKVNAKSLRPKLVRSLESESGYGTDTDRSDDYLYSPSVSSGPGWTALNTPRSVASQQYPLLHPRYQLSTSPTGPVPRSREPEAPKKGRPAKRPRMDEESEYEDDGSSFQSSLDTPMLDVASGSCRSVSQETRAAYLLLQLKMDDTALDGERGRRRRAST